MRYATPYGAFHVDPMPGNPQVAICSGFFVFPKHRSKGNGHRLKAYQENVLFEQGYSLALCTVRADNAPQLAVLAKAQWDEGRTFFNEQTSALTTVFTLAIYRERTA
ncbi:MAG: GNAT family N-acetyltransferase [Azonexus sp.]